MRIKLFVLFLILTLTACGSIPGDTDIAETDPESTAPVETATTAPTATVEPTATAAPTEPPTATPEPTATAEPTATSTPDSTPTPEPTATPAVSIAPPATLVDLPGIFHEYQRLNNCGPVSTSMALSYYGINLTQYDIAPIVKGADTDKNATPEELSRFIQEQGLSAPVRVNGNLEILKVLLSNDIPVIVEQWLDRPGDPLTAHYRVVRGYDEAAGLIYVNDSYTGPNMRYTEAEFDQWWQAYHRVYLPVYPADKEPLVRAIIGEDQWDERAMWQRAAERASAEIASAPNLYAWYNLGEARLRLGDIAGAVEAFEQSLSYDVPVRFPWYVFAHLEAFNAAALHDRVLEVTQGYRDAYVEEIHYQRGVALEALGRADEALAEYRTAIQLNPRQAPQQEAVARLEG